MHVGQINARILLVWICRTGRIDRENKYRTSSLVAAYRVGYGRLSSLEIAEVQPWPNIRAIRAATHRIGGAICRLAEIDRSRSIVYSIAICVVIHCERGAETRPFNDTLSDTNLERNGQRFARGDVSVPFGLRSGQVASAR